MSARACRSASNRATTCLQDLERDLPPHGLDLLRHVDHAEPTLADLLEELVAVDRGARALGYRRLGEPVVRA
jgi:hypothetical protein